MPSRRGRRRSEKGAAAVKRICGYIAVYILAVALTGCATTSIPDTPAETKVAVGVPCLAPDQVPERPDFITDAQLAAKSDDQFVISLASDRLARIDYERKLEAAIIGCV